MPIEEAKKLGAMALFGEKYGDVVRVIKMGDSIELCGGTHVLNTGAIQGFKIVSESGVASGVRRIEAVTGKHMFDYFNEKLDLIVELSKLVKTTPANLTSRVGQLLDELKAEKKEVESLKSKLAKDSLGDINIEDINGYSFICKKIENIAMNDLRNLGDDIKSKNSEAIILLAGTLDDKVNLIAMVPENVIKAGIKAGDIIKEISPLVDGKGGGRPNMAQGGGNNTGGIDLAFDKAREYIKSK